MSLLGQVYYSMIQSTDSIGDAMMIASKAKGAWPVNPILRRSVGDVTLVLGDQVPAKMAEQNYLSALKDDPNSPDYLRGLAITYYRLGDMPKAQSYLNMASLMAKTKGNPATPASGILPSTSGGKGDLQ